MMVWGRDRLRREEALQRGWCWWKERPANSPCPLSFLFLFLLQGHLVGTVSLLFVRWPVEAWGEVETEGPGARCDTGVARGFVGSTGAVVAGLAGAGS